MADPKHTFLTDEVRAWSKRSIEYHEFYNMAVDSFMAAKARFLLTAFGMVVGTASLILVVTIGLTGKKYILEQIQAIGANMVYAYYEGGGNATINRAQADFLTIDDMRAVQARVPGIVASSPMLEIHDRIPVQGKERDILILGVDPGYRAVRNLVILHGRFFDEEDSMSRNKVAVVTPKFATKAFGSPRAAVGKPIKINNLPFVIVGTFKERVQTFGQSEIADDTILIPYTVGKFFAPNDTVKQIFFSISDTGKIASATTEIKRVLQSRHRPESNYRVDNLTELIRVADEVATTLTIVLLLISTITLLVSGVGIMNIMLANVRSRIREIGIRKSIGATRREIKIQFLMEAVFISVGGGLVGTVVGLALPLLAAYLTEYKIPISPISVVVALTVASLVGVLFGTLPAVRAAELDPVESLRYE